MPELDMLVVSVYLGLFLRSRTHLHQSGRLPAPPDQEGKRGPTGHSGHQKGTGLRGLSGNDITLQALIASSCVHHHEQHMSCEMSKTYILPALPNEIMMSAVPSKRRVKVSGVTSLHTLKALAKASSIRELSMSGE